MPRRFATLVGRFTLTVDLWLSPPDSTMQAIVVGTNHDDADMRRRRQAVAATLGIRRNLGFVC